MLPFRQSFLVEKNAIEASMGSKSLTRRHYGSKSKLKL